MSTTQSADKCYTITYKTVKDVPIKFDIYPPASFTSDKPLPSVVHFHGGGFALGSRLDFLPVWLQSLFFGQIPRSYTESQFPQSVCMPQGSSSSRQIIVSYQLEEAQDTRSSKMFKISSLSCIHQSFLPL